MALSEDQVRVLFICMGNICRSPASEGVFRDFVAKKGYMELIGIDSAGTISYHTGNPPDQRMQDAASRRGYNLDSVARAIQYSDMQNFDLIIPMDHENLMDVEQIVGGPKPHIRLLGTYLIGYETNDLAPPVPDPYYGGESGFEQVLDMIENACPAILAHCLKLHAVKKR